MIWRTSHALPIRSWVAANSFLPSDWSQIGTVTQLLRALGAILVLGGLGHSVGVVHLYLTSGVPEVNRVLLDVWVAEAQVVGGSLYVAAFRAMRADREWRGLAIAGAVTILAYALPFIPVLFARAPLMFRIPATVYALASVFIVWRTAGLANADPEAATDITPSRRS